jgi:hypothetical protein
MSRRAAAVVFVVRLEAPPGAEFFSQLFPCHAWRSVAGGSIARAIKEKVRIMDMRKYAGERFLKVADLDGGSIQETIAVIKPGKYDKPNVVFESGNLLGLNVTNTRTLVRAYGSNSTDWIGKAIELYVGEVEVRDGELQDAILVRPLSPVLPPEQRTKLQPQPEKAPQLSEQPQRDPSDEIPF